jgi:putative endonuclease
MVETRMDPSRLGRLGEWRALWYFRLRGYRVLARNLRSVRGEIDLVVRRFGTIAFVEVKTRQSRGAGAPHEAVDGEKQGRILAMAAEFLLHYDARGCMIRFDVVSAFWDGRRMPLTHYADAFRPMSDRARPWLIDRSRSDSSRR